MLARPEPGTREHMLLWLAGKAPDETYEYYSYADCACGQYARETMGLSNHRWAEELMGTSKGRTFCELNRMAAQCATFGELYERAERAWRRLDAS